MEVKIKKGKLSQAITIDRQIPEFDNGYGEQEYLERLKDKNALILIAEIDEQAVGFKIGYKEKDYFYSWMGGIIPEFRNRGIATKLARQQEELVHKMGISKIRFKTQNKFKGMLIFALKNGYSIVGTVPFDGGEGFKILLEKELN